MANAVILAGGNNSRISRQKAFIEINGLTIIESLISKLAPLFNKIIIVANDPEKYLAFDLQVVADLIPEKGPLGGIYTGLSFSDETYNFVIACDMPCVNSDLVSYMAELEGYDAVIPKIGENIEPLHALYSKDCINAIKDQLDRGELKIRSLLPHLKVKYLEEDIIRKYDPEGQSFININTENDLREIAKPHARKS
jgi:molybdopterin-guanine dinucleotide biosynthesis protein A